MLLSQITYILNGGTVLAGPETLGLAGVTLVTQVEEGQAFFRQKWTGEITFTGVDYRALWASAQATCCETVGIALYRQGDRCVDQPTWTGVFNLSDLKFNIDACTATLKTPPRPNDGYQTLMENWDKSVNWLEVDALNPIYSHDQTLLYKRGRLLTRVLAGLVGLTLADTPATALIPTAGTDTISLFLESATNPVTRVPNPLKGVTCIQASDAISEDNKNFLAAVDYAVKAQVTLHEIVTDLQELLNLYPYIDPSTGKLRWEHISFFPSLSYGPVSAVYHLPPDNEAWTGKRGLQTDSSKLYGIYSLSTLNEKLAPRNTQTTTDSSLVSDFLVFTNQSLTFSDACVTRLPGETPLTKQRSVTRLVTNIAASRFNPDKVEKDKWIFLVASEPTTLHFGLRGGMANRISGDFYENGELSTLSVLTNYHKHNQPFASGLINGNRKGMTSVAPVRQLDSVTISYCCTDVPIVASGLFETWYGPDGLLVKATHQVASGLLTLEIAHPGPCQVPGANSPIPGTAPGTCPPKGTPTGQVKTTTLYCPADPLSGLQLVRGTITETFYTDGNCGEYSLSQTNLSPFSC